MVPPQTSFPASHRITSHSHSQRSRSGSLSSSSHHHRQTTDSSSSPLSLQHLSSPFSPSSSQLLRPPSRDASFHSPPSFLQKPLPHPSTSRNPSSSPSDIDQRPSTAPGSQFLSRPVSKGSDTERHAVRKSPTVSDLQVPERPKSRRLSSSGVSGTSSLLSPTAQTSISSASRSASSRSDRRSPSARRPPASFSANGIETSYGPPPSLITRNPYHSELARLVNNPAASTLSAQQQKPYHANTFPLSINPNLRPEEPPRPRSSDKHTDWTNLQVEGLLSPTSAGPRVMDSLSAMVQTSTAPWSQTASSGRSQVSSDNSPNPQQSATFPRDDTMDSSQSSEDLFLKLADDKGDPSDVTEVANEMDNLQLRSRRNTERNPFNPDSTPAFSSRRRNSSPVEPAFINRHSMPVELNTGRQPGAAASVVGIPTRSSNANNDAKINAYRSRYLGNQASSAAPPAPKSEYTPSRRRSSAAEHFPSRTHQHRPSRLNYTSTADSEYSPSALRYGQEFRADGESVVSTVQSNIWDDMHELKSHVNRIEHRRGAGSSGSGERPRTATTTVTTVSSSPKLPKSYKMGATDSFSAAEAMNLHPLLQQALARAKTAISPNEYRTLESLASDALEIAVLARSGGSNGSIYSSSTAIHSATSDRLIRRKADNMCRTLTDWCITQSEEDKATQVDTPSSTQTQTFAQRRASRDYSVAPSRAPTELLRPYSRHASVEPEEARPPSSRALERVEARRVSMLGISTPSGSPREAQKTFTTPAMQSREQFQEAKSSPLTSNLLRSGTSLLRTRRTQTQVEDDDDTSSQFRAPSRAATEVGAMLRKRGDRTFNLAPSRNGDGMYTSQHPLPPINTGTRRVTGSVLESPRTPSLLRRYLGSDRQHLTTGEEHDIEEKKAKRRSLGLYTGSSGSSGTSRTRPVSISVPRSQGLLAADQL